MPYISVVIPVFNGERFVAATIESVLAQGRSDIEVIVVNDGSTDGTLQVLSSFGTRIILFSQGNAGQAVARNVGLRAAQGSIIGLLDADDLWPQGRLDLCVPYLSPDSPYDFVRGHVRYFRGAGEAVEDHLEPLVLEPLIGACLYKASVFRKVGLFDEELRQGEDFDWNIRLRESECCEKRLDEVTLLYRRHDANLTNDEVFVKQGQINAFRKKLERARTRTHLT